MRGTRIVAGVLILILILAACGSREEEKTKLKVVYAGSLIVPLEEVERRFEGLHPDVDIEMEGHGSIQVIRYVTDLKKEADVLAVADYALIPAMMYPEYADWHIRFATNELVIAYTENSLYASEISSSNWYEVLSRPGVKIGLPHPLLDACGYRALMAVRLAETYYQEPTLFQGLIGDHFTPAVSVREDHGRHTVYLPEVIKPRDEKFTLRGGSIQLLALMEAGAIDYAFEYRSVALQRGLKYVELPSQINLGAPDQEEFYQRVGVAFGFQRFTSLRNEQEGNTIYYAVTIPKNAPHRSQALEYVQFLLGPEGERIFQQNSHPFISPITDNPADLPPELTALVQGE